MHSKKKTKNSEEETEPIPFDDALRRILKAPHIKQERGKKKNHKGQKPKGKKPPK